MQADRKPSVRIEWLKLSPTRGLILPGYHNELGYTATDILGLSGAGFEDVLDTMSDVIDSALNPSIPNPFKIPTFQGPDFKFFGNTTYVNYPGIMFRHLSNFFKAPEGIGQRFEGIAVLRQEHLSVEDHYALLAEILRATNERLRFQKLPRIQIPGEISLERLFGPSAH